MRLLPVLLLLIFPVLSAFAQNNQSRGLSLISEKEIKDETGNSGKRYAICIGINEYEHSDIQDLSKAGNDARALGAIFKEEGQFDQVFIMTDDVDPRYDEMQQYPRLRNIKYRLDYLKDFINPEDLVVVTFSGHGISNSSGEGFLIVADTDFNNVFPSSFPISELVSWVEEMGVEKSLFLIDACREQVSENTSRSLSNNKLRAERFESAQLGAIFYATKTGWYSYEDRESDYGVFTRFLLDGIRGKADYQFGNSDSIVTFRELSAFVEESVSNYAMNLGLKQKPYTDIYGEFTGDLVISSYTASVNVQVRGVSSLSVKEDRSVFGSLSLYSNVGGLVKIDGEEQGEIKKGETRIIEDLYEGSHFVEISHDYGKFRNDFTILEDKTNELSNIVVLSEQEIKVINELNFVYIKGNTGIPGFWISESEITLGQFKEFIEDSGYEADNHWDDYYRINYDYYPVHNVSKLDAVEFTNWFSRKFRTPVSLPALAQWQFAAGGNYNNIYPWGDFWDSGYCQNSNSQTPGILPIIGEDGPTQIQIFQKDITLDGVTNMAGNVREWCLDERTNSEGSVIGTIAGGSWKLSRSRNFKSTYTGSKPVYQAAEDLGFRMVIR